MISFLMTLQCFEKYNYDNYYQWTDTELEFHSYNQNENEYNEEMHCNVLQINELMHGGDHFFNLIFCSFNLSTIIFKYS
jgi:hypothetical protein